MTSESKCNILCKIVACTCILPIAVRQTLRGWPNLEYLHFSFHTSANQLSCMILKNACFPELKNCMYDLADTINSNENEVRVATISNTDSLFADYFPQSLPARRSLRHLCHIRVKVEY